MARLHAVMTGKIVKRWYFYPALGAAWVAVRLGLVAPMEAAGWLANHALRFEVEIG